MEYGLIGEKLGHSYSVMIHRRLAGYRYELKEIAPEDLDAFLDSRDFRGLNVTIPYKRAAMAHCAELSPEAREIGCVNTIAVRRDGTLYGHNTDIGGFRSMLRRGGIDPKGRKCVVLGSGGTSLTARTALRHMGAAQIITVSRSGPVDYEALYRDHADAEILVNTTPVGMYPGNGKSAADLSRFRSLIGVADVIYNPERTKLILDATEMGIPAVPGLSMLVAQAREAAELFTGEAIDPGREDAIIGEINAQTLNLVLIGMPGCGKRALGALAAKAMSRRLVSCDEEIERRAGMPIPRIFAERGEEAFRDLEREVIAELSRESGTVIATGGGAVLRADNVRALRQNGRLCLIRRPPDRPETDGRPLSQASGGAVLRTWNARRELYETASDYAVDNDTDTETAARAVVEGFYEAARH